MDLNLAKKHLQDAIQCETVSYYERERINFKEYDKFIKMLKKNYPLLHKKAELVKILDYSLIFHIKGSTDQKPVAFMGHYDVVPVSDSWVNKPFGGEEIDGYIYGRGTLDMKGHVIALLEAMESLLEENYEFGRDVYLLFGHNEETGSSRPDSGALNTMNYFKDKGIEFYSVMDEGGAFIDGKSLGVNGVVALIGVGEKGYLDVELSAKQNGGHASMPPEKSALFEVFEAASKMESDKFKLDFNEATHAMFEGLIPYMDAKMKFVFKNRNLLKPIVLKAMAKDPKTAAIVRTTSVMTMAQGSKAPNVLPQEAKVNINCRLVPGDSVEQVLNRIKERVGSKISVEAKQSTEPTTISPSNHPSFMVIKKAVEKVYPNFVTTVPYLMVAATDSRVYHGLAEGVYRINPFESAYADLHTVHADDERLSLDSYYKGIEFFKEILKNTSKV